MYKPNVLSGLSQNGTRQGMASVKWAIMDNTPPANRRDPPRSEIHAEQGKPVVLPATAGGPRGTLLAMRVEDCGKSERLAVMARIRAETFARRESGQTSARSFMARKLD